MPSFQDPELCRYKTEARAEARKLTSPAQGELKSSLAEIASTRRKERRNTVPASASLALSWLAWDLL